MTNDAEEKLPGGWGKASEPVKIGQTVHRELSKNSAYVHKLLSFFESSGFDWAPRYFGQDDQGREIVSFIDGYVPHDGSVLEKTWSLETMQEIFAHIRQFHDLTAGTTLAKDNECVCHGDLSYANTVYQDGRAVAFIDWDWAHPGHRVDDVAYALLQYLSLGEYESAEGPAERAHLAGQLADAYGLTKTQRLQTITRLPQLLLETRDKQLQAIRASDPAAKRLADAGVPEQMLVRHGWVTKNIDYFRRTLA